MDNKKTFWITSAFTSNFMKRFNLKLAQSKGTTYSKTGLLCQLVPSLEMTCTIRKLFNVPHGKGRILNADESMTYRFDEKSKSWRF